MRPWAQGDRDAVQQHQRQDGPVIVGQHTDAFGGKPPGDRVVEGGQEPGPCGDQHPARLGQTPRQRSPAAVDAHQPDRRTAAV